ncbi:SDR family oxidoreductase [Fervidibacillus halotolerans]|uniref:SDR family oxidoreductase n=1 Tax=Fervidibacillus halotolerans TaxID=2980027 RepID=A0A9E8RZD3_9BACI|nr:SDR family oxidoreductase [Fervidibacillus halotolerans]WAA13218.1 SDR family oxidoreductase [Fervidibacillus halotolerans]
MEWDFSGKTALVAASSQGLGKAIAEQLAKLGANVMISSRNEEKLKKVQTELNRMNKGRVEYCVTDLTKKSDIDNLIQRTLDTFGTIDLLVNNSGGPPAGSFEDFHDEDWQAAFELNLLSYIRLIRGALPALKKKGGKILNIASSSVKEPIPGLILSNTFRTGITGLSKTLAKELAPYQILINTLCPGRIETDRIKELDEVNAQKLGITTEEFSREMKKTIPLNRYGTPEEFAKVAVFLLSDLNTYMTGSTLFVDGGALKSI